MITITARRLLGIEESATLRISSIAGELARQGKDVVNLSLGEPDFPTPPHICAAAKEAIDRGETHYSPSAGIPALKKAIADKLSGENGLEAKPGNIIVTPGAKQAIFEAVLAILDEGDEAILYDPAWVTYDACIKLAGARTEWVGTEDGFEPVELSGHITGRTKLIIINSPCNPTGAVYGGDSLEMVADIARDKGIYVLSDEIYEKIIYDREHVSIGSFDGMSDLTITVNGFSKAYAMTGWRLGYVHAPKAVYEQMLKLNSHSVSQAPTFVQFAGVEALRGDQTCVQAMVDEFRARRDIIVKGLNALGLKCSTPNGAFYVFADVSDFGSGGEVAELLLNKAYIATTPGVAFGEGGRNFIRFSYATSRERIHEALRRIGEAL